MLNPELRKLEGKQNEMLDPQTQKKIALLEAHYRSMGKILSELKADPPKQRRKLSYDQEAQVLANRLSKIK